MKIVIYFFSTKVYFNCECGNEYFYGEVVCDTWLYIEKRRERRKKKQQQQQFNSIFTQKKMFSIARAQN